MHCRLQPLENRLLRRCIQREIAILVGGARAPDPSEVARLSPDADAAERLARLYGDEAASIVADGGDVAAEARHAVSCEGAVALEDYWVRRSARAWFDERAGLDALEPAAAVMAQLLGWSDATRAAQIALCRSIEHQSRRQLAGPPRAVPAEGGVA